MLLDLLFSIGDTTHFLVAPKFKSFRVFTLDGSTKVKDTVSPAPGHVSHIPSTKWKRDGTRGLSTMF